MSNITRRNLLKQSPAALVVAAVPIGATVSALPAQATVATATENPELLAAYNRFLAARDEVAAAEDALEWLADEWRHLWPLAPQEILWFMNANEYDAGAERDIIGRIIVRDTSDMTKRLTREWREKHPRTCFTVNPPEWFQETIDLWERPRTGKTAKALARNQAEQVKVLSEYRHKLRLSEEYHAETARLRSASGVEQAKQRLKTAEAELERACSDVSYEPAYTIDGLLMKADVLQIQDDGMAVYLRDKRSALGGMARFIDATLSVIGRVSA